ncbi:MAG: hypothetical protein HC882_02915 [Acidobacteria bacterium]|nr:hypothetical protein [Acidobacteriota bacterium]
MKTLLVMTVGRTDVELVLEGERREFGKDRVGAVHDRLRDRLDAWELVASPTARGEVVGELPDTQPWEICTPKFDAVLAYLGGTPPDSVLLLETTRDLPDDPRFAGGVLSKRARGKGIQDIRCCAYLGPGDRTLEDRDCALDAIIRRDVVRRIENAIRDAVKDATRIVVAPTGGMPEIKALVKELVRLHAPEGIEPDEIEVDDGARNSGQPDRAVSRKRVDPIEPIRLRKQALELTSKGHLIGAWGAVRHLDAQVHPWKLVIEWLYHFASSLPIPPECDLIVIQHQRMAVRAALRVELALRAGDIPRAVHGTVAFFEAALWDHLLKHFERDPQDARWLKPRAGALVPTDKLIREGDDDDKNRPFETKSRPDNQAWFWFHESGAGRFIRDYVESKPLKNLLDAIDKVKALRNDVAHNEPTPELMNDARTRMQAAALWSNTDMFLSQPPVQAVLRELGEASPENLLSNLMAEVGHRLRDSLAADSPRGRDSPLEARDGR